jgi:GT2 family glycosyltransferase
LDFSESLKQNLQSFLIMDSRFCGNDKYMKPKVFIIILNWNEWRDTIECLESLEKIDYLNYQIVLVDNGSKNESVLQLEKFCSEYNEDLVFLKNQNNLGFAGGNNVGIKCALENQADYVLLLNNDTIVESDFLTQLIKAAKSDKKIGMLGPKINFYNRKDRIWFLGGKINRLLNKGTHLYYDQIDSVKNLPNKLFEVDYFTGCALLIKKEVIKKIGLMWDGYFLYYEDTDWNLKAKKNGWKIVVAPKAKIYHKVSRSAKPGSFSYIYYHTRNGLYLAKRNGSFLIRFCAYLNSFWILIKQMIKLIFIPKKRMWAKAVIKGIKDFYLGKTGRILD